jgi:YVTN family beta-propeller protein
MTMERGAPRLTTLVLAGALVLLAGCSSDGSGDGSSGADGSAGPTASTGPTGPQPAELEATVEVGADPIGIASGEGSVWVVNAEINAKRGSVSRIDPTTNEVLATIDVGSVPLEVAIGEGSVWVSNSGDDTVSRIAPS